MHQRIDTDPQIETILTRHHISPRFFPDYYRLVEDGEIRNHEFRTRLKECVNYQAAVDEIMEYLGQPYSQLFTPPPSHFISLDESDYPSETL